MDFFEFLMAVSVAVVLPIVLVKLFLDYRRERLRLDQRDLPAQNALTVGELKSIVREVVGEVNAPLVERMAALERQDRLLESGRADEGADEPARRRLSGPPPRERIDVAADE